jgi:RimJ/RimL family protein N-acetyltransferase
MNITLRKLLLKDKTNLLKLFLNENTLKDTGVNISHEKINLNFVNEWLKERIEQYNLEKPDFLIYAISDNSKKIIGTIGIGDINYKDKTAEIGYWVSEENAGKGHCTNAIKIFMKTIPKLLNLNRIIAEVSQENIASHKVLEKNGFKTFKKSKNKLLLEKETKI